MEVVWTRVSLRLLELGSRGPVRCKSSNKGVGFVRKAGISQSQRWSQRWRQSRKGGGGKGKREVKRRRR